MSNSAYHTQLDECNEFIRKKAFLEFSHTNSPWMKNATKHRLHKHSQTIWADIRLLGFVVVKAFHNGIIYIEHRFQRSAPKSHTLRPQSHTLLPSY